LAIPQSVACVALSAWPITENSNARRWPISSEASRLEPASGTNPRLSIPLQLPRGSGQQASTPCQSRKPSARIIA
jgi:hypothetical protein